MLRIIYMTYISLSARLAVCKLDLLERELVAHPVAAASWRVHVDVLEELINVALSFPRHNPLVADVFVSLVVGRHASE